MYKIIIVDDEPIAVKSVQFMINKNFHQIEVIDCARSGKDAIEKAYKHHPDIMFMDINMPGINGIDAIKRIKENNPDIHFVILSAFDYFDYAKEAINLGVEEYLLKPIKETNVVNTLSQVIKNIEKERKSVEKELELKEKMEIIMPVLEAGFINSICIYEDSFRELNTYKQLFKCKSGYIMVIEFGEKCDGEITNKIGAGIKGERIYEEVINTLKSMYKCIAGPVMLNRIIVFIHDEEELDCYEQKLEAVMLAHRFFSRIQRFFEDVNIGLGCVKNEVSEIKNSYQEAVRALRELAFDKNNNVMHVNDIVEGIESSSADYEQLFEKLIYIPIDHEQSKEAIISFIGIYNRMTGEKNCDIEIIKKNIILLITGFEKRWGNIISNYSETILKVITAEDYIKIKAVSLDFIKECINKICSVKQKRINSVIEKANNYMKKNLSSEITLEEIAKEVNLSSFYFSRFYKEETGINFIDKLISMRIDKSCELLKNPDISVKEAAFMVGYSDPNYFSKLFKKVMGVTATDYKKKIVEEGYVEKV